MLDILIQLNLFGKLIKTSIDLHPHIAAPSGLIQKPGMSSLTPADYRCKKLDLLTFRKCHDLVYHLIYRLPADLTAALRTMRDSHTGI